MVVDVTGWFSVTGVLAVSALSLFLVWTWSSYRKATMFKRLGIPGPSAWPFVYNTPAMLKEGFIDIFDIWYKKYPKIYGCFIFGVPSVVVSDLDLIKDIMVKKFGEYRNRVYDPTVGDKPWSENLLNLRDDHWKHVRSQLSPSFSSGKLKKMTATIQRVVKNLGIYVKEKAESGEEVELKKMCRTFAVDAIGGVAFGLQVDSLKDPNDIFAKHSERFVNFDSLFVVVLMLCPSMLRVLKKIGIQFPPKDAEQFFVNVLDSALKERRTEQTKHADFLQLLVDAEKEGENQGPVDAEIDHGDQMATSTKWTRKGLTQDEIYANTLVFLFAGNETVNTVMSFTLFCMANNPECLAKAHAEVDAKLGKRQVDYETANSLTYLDMCMNEAMRLYPPGFFLDREASEDTDIAGYHVIKGMRMTVPVMNIHRDPAIWPDPLTFDPERFTPENRAARHPFAFMPFGLGPRNCIGMRLAQLEIRMALATILQNYTLVPCGKTVYPPKLQKMKFEAVDGLWVKFQARA